MSHRELDFFGDPVAAAVDPHVRSCDDCLRMVQDQQSIRDLLAAGADPGPPPAGLMDQLSDELLTAASAQEEPRGADVLPASLPSRRRGRPLLAAAAAGLVLAGTYGAVRWNADQSPSPESAAPARRPAAQGLAPQAEDRPAIASGTNYTRALFARQVERALAADPDPTSRTPLGTLSEPAGLRGCLAALAVPGARLVLADVARFEGRPAAILVLAGPDGSREAWVVSPSCRPGLDGTTYFQRLS
jgi:hypothetical protein